MNIFCKLISSIISLLFSLLVILAILGAIFYFVYHPKAPEFSIDRLRITDLKLNLDLSLYAQFNVRITSKNPNDKIGIYYENGGKTSVWYKETELCRGVLPTSYQKPLSTKVLDVQLSGQNQVGKTLMDAIGQQQQTGNVPLDLKVDQPVSIRVGSVKVGRVRVLANCKLMVDSLTSSSPVTIKTSSCSIRVKV